MLIATKAGREAELHVRRLREAVEKRAREKGLTLAEALLEIHSEGTFSASDVYRDVTVQDLETGDERGRQMAGNGKYRRQFAREVGDKKEELMRRNRDLSELEAYQLATSQICKDKPELLTAYRADITSV